MMSAIIVIISILDSTIITLLSSDIVSPVHVVDVFFLSPLEPSSFHQFDDVESKWQQEQNEENTWKCKQFLRESILKWWLR